jgi:hypothetical protein
MLSPSQCKVFKWRSRDRGTNANRKTPTQMKLQTLKDLYIHELKALYSAEKQILEALPKMVPSDDKRGAECRFPSAP